MKIHIEYQDQFGKWLHYSTMNHQTIALKTAQNRAKNNRQEATTNISEDDDDEELGICSWSVYIYKSAIELISNSISTLPLILISLHVSPKSSRWKVHWLAGRLYR
jgi:hypothetical protein